MDERERTAGEGKECAYESDTGYRARTYGDTITMAMTNTG